MSTHNASRYEIRLQGRLDERWTACFDDMTISVEPGGVTLLRGRVADQAAPHGLLARLRDLGLPLISVTPGDTDDTGDEPVQCQEVDE